MLLLGAVITIVGCVALFSSIVGWASIGYLGGAPNPAVWRRRIGVALVVLSLGVGLMLIG